MITPDPPSESAHPGRTRRISGLITVGVGAVLVGTGAVFSKRASNAARTVEEQCKTGCGFDEVATIDADGKAAQRSATRLYLVGGAALAVGAAIFTWGWLDGRAPAAQIAVLPSSSGAMVFGGWDF